MEPQLLIFDLDGTLIDSRKDLAAAANHMRAHYGLEPLALETISSYVGDGVRKLVERSLQGADEDVDEALRINKEFYFANLTVHTYLYDGVSEGLKQLAAAGHKIALLTNKPGDPSRSILDYYGLSDYFCSIVGGGDVPNLKPHPEGIVRICETAEMDLSEAWMIGDHHTDLASAENAGTKSAFVQYGFGNEDVYKPDTYFASFSDLVGYFV